MTVLNWLVANWMTIAVAVLSLAEIVSLFMKGNGTLQGIIDALKKLGVKDVGGQ